METLARKIAGRLLEAEAVKLRPETPFTWASGRKSPIYCDNRILLSYPDIRKDLIEGFRQASLDMPSFGQVAGVATAGIAHGALLAHALELPFLYVRSKPKAHGRQNQIEGKLDLEKPVLVIEDLISTGGSSLKAIDALVEAGASIAGVLAIFSYGFEEARLAFEHAGYPMATLTTYPILLEEAVKGGFIAAEELETLEKWRANPAQWPG